MINVKISYPSWWDKDWGGSMYLKETPGHEGIWDGVRFFLNEDVEECDFWFVYDDIDRYLVETTRCPSKNVFFITGEVVPYWEYPVWFLNQFAGVLTARSDIIHQEVHPIQHVSVWHIKKSYDQLLSHHPTKLKKNVSAIISAANKNSGHKARFKFIGDLKEEMGQELEWFGKGINPISNKWDGLEPYKYSIAIENSSYHNYFTEKIIDCFLAYTIPIYYGCPNIADIFPKESMILIDITDIKGAKEIIEKAIRNNYYEKHYEALKRARNIALNRSGFFPYLTQWIKLHRSTSEIKKDKIVIKGKKYKNLKTLKQRLYAKKIFTDLHLKGYKIASEYN